MSETTSLETMDAAAPNGAVFEVDVEKRTIRGLVVPFGVDGIKNGRTFRFSKGTVRIDQPRRMKLWVGHDKTQAVGVAFELTETDEPLEDAPFGGVLGAYKVARGPEGDRALTMAADGVWDGLSLGPSEGARYRIIDGVYHAVDIPAHETSLTPAPVFGGARVRSVSFDQHNNTEGTPSMTTTTTETTTPPAETTTAAPVTFDAGTIDQLGQAFAQALGNLNPLPQGRQTVDPTGGLEVSEPSPYRFDGIPAEHSFALDLRASVGGDSEAKQRLSEFVTELETFAVTQANVASLNPVKNRPDLYVPNLTFNRPLWDLVTTGTLTDITAFTIPKFSSASGLVGTHTAGTEPTPGAFAATVQTVTPTAVSGKIEILREV